MNKRIYTLKKKQAFNVYICEIKEEKSVRKLQFFFYDNSRVIVCEHFKLFLNQINRPNIGVIAKNEVMNFFLEKKTCWSRWKSCQAPGDIKKGPTTVHKKMVEEYNMK